MLRLSCLLTVLLCLSAAPGAQADDLPATFQPGPDTPLDLGRHAGRWYVVGRIPHPAERGHVGSHSDYIPQGDGNVRIVYRFRAHLDAPEEQRELRSSASPSTGFRRWRTWHFGVLPGRSEVLEVERDYRWALVATPGRSMAWILSRDPAMEATTYRALLERLAGHGVPTDRMRRVVHLDGQRGQLGFETPPTR